MKHDIFLENKICHTKLMSASQVKQMYNFNAMLKYNDALSVYIEHFNKNFIVDETTSVVKCVFNENKFPDFENQTFWFDLYTIFINAGYTNVRLSKLDMFYIIEADILTKIINYIKNGNA